VIPAILDAPGAVVSTSNKRDVVDRHNYPLQTAGLEALINVAPSSATA
jgi:hypothetical protein